MNCDLVQEQLTALELGELAERRVRNVETHLHSCSACRRAQRDHHAMTSLLAGYAAPPLPEGFEKALQERLSESPADTGQPALAMEGTPSRWRTVSRATALVAAGVIIGALGLWWLSAQNRAPTSGHPASGTVSAPGTAATPVRLRRGEIAVVTLVVHVTSAAPAAALEVVLPDGLALVGNGLTEYPEKQLRWSEALHPGQNRIRVPVKARRSGQWQLVARVRTGERHTTTRVTLEVTS